jgi:hypothetical protein
MSGVARANFLPFLIPWKFGKFGKFDASNALFGDRAGCLLLSGRMVRPSRSSSSRAASQWRERPPSPQLHPDSASHRRRSSCRRHSPACSMPWNSIVLPSGKRIVSAARQSTFALNAMHVPCMIVPVSLTSVLRRKRASHKRVRQDKGAGRQAGRARMFLESGPSRRASA